MKLFNSSIFWVLLEPIDARDVIAPGQCLARYIYVPVLSGSFSFSCCWFVHPDASRFFFRTLIDHNRLDHFHSNISQMSRDPAAIICFPVQFFLFSFFSNHLLASNSSERISGCPCSILSSFFFSFFPVTIILLASVLPAVLL